MTEEKAPEWDEMKCTEKGHRRKWSGYNSEWMGEVAGGEKVKVEKRWEEKTVEEGEEKMVTKEGQEGMVS